MVFFVGFGLGGNIPIDETIVLEFLPNVCVSIVWFPLHSLTPTQDRRYLLAALSVFQPIGA